MLKKIALLASVLALSAGPILADHHLEAGPPPPPQDGTPQMMLMPPPGTIPPEDPGEPPADQEGQKGWLAKNFFEKMDANGDGWVSEEELRAWVTWVYIGDIGGKCGDGDGECPDDCPEESVEITLPDLYLDPAGHESTDFTVPEDHEAGCFYFEFTGADLTTTPNHFHLVDNATSSVVWDSMADGQSVYESLILPAGDYTAEVISCAVPTAIFSISYKEYPVGP